MTSVLFTVLAAAILVVGELDRRRRDRAALAELAQLHAAHEGERRAWSRERQLLLNRIKPETAQFVTPDQSVSAPPAAGVYDDDAYWSAVNDLSKDDLAAAVMSAELAERAAYGVA